MLLISTKLMPEYPPLVTIKNAQTLPNTPQVIKSILDYESLF